MSRVAITIACVVTGLSSRGVADVATAEAFATEAERLATAKDFVGAAAKFRQAFAEDDKAEYLCNVGVAYHKAKTQQPRAHLFLTRCQERATVLTPRFVAAVNTALTAVDRELRAGDFTPVQISVEPKTTSVAISTFAADEGFVGPRAIWLPRGTHELRFTADGYQPLVITVDATSRDRKDVVAKLERPVIDPGPGSGSGSAIAPPPIVVEKPPLPLKPPPPPPPGRPSKILPIATTAATAIAVAVAVVAYGNANDRAEIAEFAVSEDVFARDQKYIDRQNLYMMVSASLAVAGAGISGFLWYRALGAPTTRVEVEASGSGASVSLSGRF